MNPICRRRSALPPPAKTTPTDDENLLPEVLIRLPAQPSSLPRASLVCKQWRHLIADPQFLRRFCAHHREPPIIGVFLDFYRGDLSFRSVLDRPDLIPPERFPVRFDGIEGGGGVEGNDGIWSFRRCRHGRVLFTRGDHLGKGCRQVLVWDPVTGDRRFIGSPPQLDHDWSKSHVQADVLCAAGDKDHVHGSCHSSLFKVVLVCADKLVARACVYSSESNSWGDLISTDVPYHTMSCVGSRSILVGNSLHWFIFGTQTGILKLDLDTRSLAVVEVPPDAHASHHGLYLSMLGGGLGFIVVSDDFVAQLWVRTTDFDGVAGWMPAQAVELNKLLPLRPGEWTNLQTVLGVAGDENVIFVSTNGGVFMVHLESLQFKKIFESNPFAECTTSTIHPFTSFFTAGNNMNVQG
ncbi:hypothetical protein CFC21_011806 [Triticum aestivum]|uniref:Uncharacterized protein n=2 Tax=Triticum aestivum TaxID=4565 RepID=A0A3B5ZU83_WHEAT|nr:uncharacterized protein LOC123181569 [Triticum aestivum]KAF6995281.1 hypothetical protein CFC21_011806 [Triticum aestivum]